ncbi:nad dependent epimerase dehydratase family protein [Colletotrichum plurivorum]|uniref:Nad dependent epimerase dehydratase family protein n=1 Tax=Colletotrichum plurivorum TaxID=2175906 RepID=A0A8H6NGD9_9PEZI|nr:nad dependent epimerase dehydratase family protein [Colletotrichum plurivorum]
MTQNILVTGAAGYIGGSLVADFVSRKSGPISEATIFAAVRSEDQIQKLAAVGATPVLVDLADEQAVRSVVLDNKINIVIHNAGIIDPNFVPNLIKALGQRRKDDGVETYFVLSSVTTAFSQEGGWPYGQIKDSDDDLFEKERQIPGLHHARKNNVAAIELAEALGVTHFNMPIPLVCKYFPSAGLVLNGRGTGEGRKISVNIPAMIRTSIKDKVVHKFEKDGNPPAVHILDLVSLYALLTEKILLREPVPSGRNGYHFVFSHRVRWSAVTRRLAEILHARGLVEKPEVRLWPSFDAAADALGFPRLYMEAIGTSSGDLVSVKPYRLGWQPKWDEEKFMASLEGEVRDALEFGSVQPTLFNDLLQTSAN